MTSFERNDWRWCGRTILTGEELSSIQLPFSIELEKEDIVPKKFTKNTFFIKAGEKGATTTGYYAKTGKDNEVGLISNAYGIWFTME